MREIYGELQFEYPNDGVSGYKLVLKNIKSNEAIFILL